MSDKQPYAFDWLMFGLIMTLACLGLVMLLSASFFYSGRELGDGYAIFLTQARHMCLGLAVMLALSRLPYQLLLKVVYPLLLLAMILLAVAHVPGVGVGKNGVYRWINLFGFVFQPSELAKLAMVIYMAYSLSRKGEKVGSIQYGLLPHLLVLGAVAGLILAGRDLGTAAAMVAVVFIMMYVAGTKIWHMGLLAAVSLPVLYWQIVSKAYRMERILSYQNPWSDPQGAGYQIIHSFYAFANGGLFGQGPGASQQKLFFLPEAHTDFIFSVTAEELGLVGVAVIALIFLMFIFRGLTISRSAKDNFGMFLALGCTLLIGIQAFFNMCVVTGVLPNKGLPLPFFSYGGSNLLICFAAAGLILNVAAQSRGERKEAGQLRKVVPPRLPKGAAPQAA